jgi:hypothetical protein
MASHQGFLGRVEKILLLVNIRLDSRRLTSLCQTARGEMEDLQELEERDGKMGVQSTVLVVTIPRVMWVFWGP